MSKQIEERNVKLQIFGATLPDSVSGMCLKNEQDDFTVVINRTHSEDQRALTFLHEMLHIWHRDQDKTGANVDHLEHERHEEMIRLLKLAVEGV